MQKKLSISDFKATQSNINMLFLLFVHQQFMAGNSNFLAHCMGFCKLFCEDKEKLLLVAE